VLKILAGYVGDGDVVDVQLVLADEMKEEFEGTLERLDPHLIGMGRGFVVE
jgi:hypothetical protein